MRKTDFESNLRVGDIFSAIRPKLTKYLYVRYEGTNLKKFGWRSFNEFYFSGSKDLVEWSEPFKKDKRAFLHAYTPTLDLPFTLHKGLKLIRKNVKKGQIENVEVLADNVVGAGWPVRLLNKFEDNNFKPFDTCVPLGFFRDFMVRVQPPYSRLLDVE